MSFLERLGFKSSRTLSAVVAQQTLGSPVWTGRNYADLAKEGYAKNVWAYRAISQITNSVKGIEWNLYRTGRGKPTEIEDHPLLDLWSRPNPKQGTGAFLETAFGFWLLSGNAYIEAVTVGAPTRPPIELYSLRPDRTRIIPGRNEKTDGIAAFRYEAGAQKIDFEPEAIMHLKLFNPLDDWYGMSPILAAAYSVDQHNASGAWNKALLDHAARPTGAFVVDGELDDEQRNRLERQVEERKTGKFNAGRPWVLEGSFDWKPMGLSPLEMDWLEGRDSTAHEIIAAFGVGAELVGLKDATYENRREAKKALYTEVVLPLLDHFRDDLNVWLTPRYSDNLMLDYDRDGIEALQEDRDKLWTRAQESTFLTVDEKRGLVGMDPLPGGAGEVILVPVSLTTLEAAVAPPEDPVDEDVDDAAEDLTGEEEGEKSLPLWEAASEERKQIAWKSSNDLRDAWEKTWLDKVGALLTKERNAIVTAVDALGDETDASKVAEAALAFVLDEPWRRLYAALMTATMEDFGERTLAGLSGEKAQKDQASFEAAVAAHVRKHTARKVTGVTGTTRKSIRKVVEQAMADGGDARAAAKALQSALGFSKARAERIARTEVLGASSAGAQEAARSTGLTMTKTWVAIADQRTRESHAAESGDTVLLDEPYANGLMFPGDPEGDPEEVVNCRCVEVYEVETNLLSTETPETKLVERLAELATKLADPQRVVVELTPKQEFHQHDHTDTDDLVDRIEEAITRNASPDVVRREIDRDPDTKRIKTVVEYGKDDQVIRTRTALYDDAGELSGFADVRAER